MTLKKMVEEYFNRLRSLDDRLNAAEMGLRTEAERSGCADRVSQAQRARSAMRLNEDMKKVDKSIEEALGKLPPGKAAEIIREVEAENELRGITGEPASDRVEEELTSARAEALDSIPTAVRVAMQRVNDLSDFVAEQEEIATGMLKGFVTPEIIAESVGAILGIDPESDDLGDYEEQAIDDWVNRLYPPSELNWKAIRDSDAVVAIYKGAEITLWTKPEGGPNVMRIPVSTKSELRHVKNIVAIVDRRRSEDWK